TINVSLFPPEAAQFVPEPGESNLRIATGDIDGDGLRDIVLAGRGAAADGSPALGFAWSRNTGSGAFEPQPLVTWESAYLPSNFLLADIDGDADLDIALPSEFELTRWFANDGAGSFSGPNDFGQNGVSRKLELADVDEDGDLDALVTFGDNSSLYFHENEGGGTFSSDQILIRGRVDDFTVLDADIDSDGDADYLFSRFGGGWGWVLNSATPVLQAGNGLPFAVASIASVADVGFVLHWTTPDPSAAYRIDTSSDMVRWEPLIGSDLKSEPSGINVSNVGLPDLPRGAGQVFFRLVKL
ncbi:MAG: hypothetical protein ACI9R3_006595, partial [Verrucomicrobiales bacterium]